MLGLNSKIKEVSPASDIDGSGLESKVSSIVSHSLATVVVPRYILCLPVG